MNLEELISNMLGINVSSRIWHWSTDVGQHHITYEQFLNQNEILTDRFVESALGNDTSIDFSKILLNKSLNYEYTLEKARASIKHYRDSIYKIKNLLEKSELFGASELITILDDVSELSSKTLYLLKLK